eukprot:1684420-Rhodomonas_salina.1
MCRTEDGKRVSPEGVGHARGGLHKGQKSQGHCLQCRTDPCCAYASPYSSHENIIDMPPD